MADKYWFSSGGFIDIQGISIAPNINARVQALCFFSGGIVQMKFVDIVGDEYTKWASDDDYLIALVGYKLGMGDRVQPTSNLPDIVNIKPFTPYTFPSGLPATVAPETVAPETVAPDTVAPVTVAPETVAPETVAPETVAPETVAPDAAS